MKIDPQEWRRLSELLDTALDLDDTARAAWLEQLADQRAPLLEPLRTLLAQRARFETNDVLQSPPDIAAALAADFISSHAPREELAPDAQIGAYRLRVELGQGGMGAVWLADRIGRFERQVALKFPYAGPRQRQLAERLARERDILAKLEHPNIARLYDADVTPSGQPFLVLEYVAGVPLDEYCRQRAFGIAERLRIFLQVLDAVQYAHARLIVHRDLKPSNILVTADGNVRLLDFGIAKILSEGEIETPLTRFGGRALTPDYASPEQVAGGAITTATDIYALGVILYELLCGVRPYRLKRDSQGALEEAIAEADVVTPSRAASTRIDSDLEAIVLKALRKDASLRYASVDALHEDLLRYLNGRPVLAQPDSAWYRLRRFSKRNRIGVAAGVGIVLVLALGLAATLWQARVARAQSVLAREQATRAERVKRFALSMFEDADVDAGGSATTTALNLLQQARVRIDAELKNEPATAVELMTSVGYSLIGLGQTEEANEILLRARELGRSRLGETDARTLAAEVVLGEALVNQSKLMEAEEVLQSARSNAQKVDDRVALTGALRWLSNLRIHQAKYVEAIDFAEAAVRAGAELPQADRRFLMEAYESLNSSLTNAGRAHSDAARKAYEIARELYGDGSSHALYAIRSTYAESLLDEGRVADSIHELEALVTKMHEIYGPRDADLGAANQFLGRAYLAAGRPHDAVKSYRDSLDTLLALKSASPMRRAVGVQRLNIAQALAAAHEFAAAEQEAKTAIEVFVIAVGPDKPNTRLAHLQHAGMLVALGRLPEAESELSQVQSIPAANARETALRDWRLGQLRLAQKRFNEADSLLASSVETLRNESPQPPLLKLVLAENLIALGRARLASGRANDAMAAFSDAQTIYESVELEPSPNHRDAVALKDQAKLASREHAHQ